MKRRTYLVGTATAVTAIAGCGSPGAGVDETETPGGGMDGTETPTEAGTPTTAETPTTTETPTTGAGPGTEAPNVQMVTDGDAFYFDPIGLFVEPGATVEWTIESGAHSSTSYEGRIPQDASPWDSGTLTESGASFGHTFETEGTYDYFCTPHKTLGMVGRVVVGQPGGPAEGSMPPDADVPESQQIVDAGSVGYDEFTGG